MVYIDSKLFCNPIWLLTTALLAFWDAKQCETATQAGIEMLCAWLYDSKFADWLVLQELEVWANQTCLRRLVPLGFGMGKTGWFGCIDLCRWLMLSMAPKKSKIPGVFTEFLPWRPCRMHQHRAPPDNFNNESKSIQEQLESSRAASPWFQQLKHT